MFISFHADIDECRPNGRELCDTELTGRNCANTPGSYQCQCLEGFEFDEEQYVCKGMPHSCIYYEPHKGMSSLHTVTVCNTVTIHYLSIISMFLYTVITTVIYYVQILMSVPWALRYVSISVLIFMEATTVHATGGTKSRVTTTVQGKEQVSKQCIHTRHHCLYCTVMDVCTLLAVDCGSHSQCLNAPEKEEGYRCRCQSGYEQYNDLCKRRGTCKL